MAVLIGVPLVAVVLFLAIVIPHAKSEWREDWRERLEALAEDRKLAIRHALTALQADALVVAEFPTAVALASGREDTAGLAPGASARDRLRKLLDRNERAHGYSGYWLFDRDGVILATSATRALEPPCEDAARRALRGPPHVSLHRHGDGSVVVAVAEPIRSEAGMPVGLVLLEAPADILLFDALRVHPALGQTAESALAEREGDNALFISPLLGEPQQPLALRVPLARAPFARAALERREGFGEGRDYRGVNVLAVSRHIEATGWGLVVKIDRSEALHELREELAIQSLALAVALLLVSGIGGLLLIRLQSALTASEARFAVLLEHAGDAIYIVDAERRIVEANLAAEGILGTTRAELIGMDTTALHGGAASDGDCDVIETSWSRPDGGTAALEITLCGVPDEPLTIAVARDVSARRAAEEALRRSERQFRAIAESLPQIVFSADAAGALDYVNEHWERMTGRPVAAALGGGWADAMHADDREEVVAAWREATATGRPLELLGRLGDGRGAFRWVLARAVPLRDGGERVERWFGSMTDIDTVKRLQEQLVEARDSLEAKVGERTAALELAQDRLRALNRRVVEVQEAERAAVARELHDEAGQSLTALLLALGTIERRAAGDAEQLSRLAGLRTMVDAVMRDLHDLAVRLRPASLDRMGLEPALRQLVRSVARDTVPVDFETIGLGERRLSEEVETSVYRVVQEAVTNAIRHAQPSRVAVMITAAGDTLVGLVEDDGVGFDVAAAENGGRLGLIGMRERIELLGGRFDVESSAHGGTTVRFEVATAAAAVPIALVQRG